jgi:hypothetical protein
MTDMPDFFPADETTRVQMEERTAFLAIKELHTPQTRYHMLSAPDYTFDNEGDAMDYADSPEDEVVTFIICTCCGDLETGHNGDSPIYESVWPCATAQTWEGIK